MEQFDIHFKSIAEGAVLLTLTTSERSEEEKYRDSELVGPIVQNVLAESIICAKLKLSRLIESWGQK